MILRYCGSYFVFFDPVPNESRNNVSFPLFTSGYPSKFLHHHFWHPSPTETFLEDPLHLNTAYAVLIITDRVRSTRREVIFSLRLSVHTWEGGWYPGQVQMKEYPGQVWMGWVPWGVPPGYPGYPLARDGVPSPWEAGWGYPPSKTGWGVPSWRGGTRYAAFGMPFAFTQEDFLVLV